MESFSLAAVNLNQTPLDWKGNRERILTSLREASRKRPDVVIFPELSITGYGCEDTFHSNDLLERSFKTLQFLADESRKILPESLLFFGLPVRFNDRIYNCMAAVCGGKIQGIVPKQNLAGDGVHYEPRWFSAWRESEQHKIAKEIPLGQMLFNYRGIHIAVEICEDSWIPARPALKYNSAGIDVILNPSASHFSFAKYQTRKNIALESSRIFGTVFVSVNLLGCEAGRLIYDGSTIAASAGEMIGENKRFSYKDHSILYIRPDLLKNKTIRTRTYSHREQIKISHKPPAVLDVRIDENKNIGFDRRDQDAFQSDIINENKTIAPDTKENEFIRASTLGLFDYMRKSKSRGYVVSLSGGVDSSACAVLVQRMVFFGVLELGYNSFIKRTGTEKLFSDSDFNEIQHPEEQARIITSRILHTIYQASENSSDTTRNAAKNLAQSLGADHHEADIKNAVSLYTELTESLIKRKLTWENDDLALQNIQARVRSPLAWMIANLTGSLLLTTSNRSEAAVGYCTMDGDTSGGLAPLAGVDKAFLRKFLIHMEKTGDAAGCIPELKAVNEQAPTAELRPENQKQSDEKDLMPYDLLDVIERLSIRDRKSPKEVYRQILNEKLHISSENPDELKGYIKLFFRLWSFNQWKRERYAASFHLDDANLDPRNWYRFPILNGAYEEELAELDT